MFEDPVFNATVFAQIPPYAYIDSKEYPIEYYMNPFTQNLENFIISVKKGHQHDLNPLLNENLWDIRFDEYTSPCMEVFSDDGVPTRSGKLNGIKILVDLETYDNGDVRSEFIS